MIFDRRTNMKFLNVLTHLWISTDFQDLSNEEDPEMKTLIQIPINNEDFIL